MNSKEIPAERPTTSRGNRRSRSNNNNDSATSNINHDFMSMFAQMELRHRLELSPPLHMSSRIHRPSSPITTTTPRFPVMRAPFTGFLRESLRQPLWHRPNSAVDVTPHTTPPEDESNSGPADDVSYGSLPSLVTRPDSTDDESEDDEAGDVMSYGSLPSLATRVDSSDEEDDDDDSSLPSLLSRSDSSDDEDSTVGSFPPLLRRRRFNAVSIPPMARRGDSTDSDDDSDGDSDSSDDSSASDGETYCEATEIERETSEYYFDNEVVIDRGPSSITRSQRRINRLSGPTSIRRNLSRVRCRCLARMTNNDAWIKLRDTMSVGRAVQ